MQRHVGLRSTKPLLPGNTGLKRATVIPMMAVRGGGGIPAAPRKPISKVSAKRARQNRERAAMADRLWPGRREGTVMCSVPGCGPADDLHEIKPRGRGGSITDEDNVTPLCRQHNDDFANKPESELQWAHDLGLLKNSWDDGGDAA